MSTTPWWDGPLVAFDTETTGTDPETARVITAALVADDYAQTWLLNPGVPIPEGSTAVHGITNEHAAHGIDAHDGIAAILAELTGCADAGVPLVVFNAPYDLTLLDREARRHGLEPEPLHRLVVIDPLVLDKACDRYRRGRRTLTATAEHYGATLTEAHTAEADATATLQVARALGRHHQATAPTYGTPTLHPDAHTMHQAQITYRAEQAASLQDWLNRTKGPTTIPGDWPILPTRTTA